MPKIVDYPETDRVAKNDVFLLDGQLLQMSVSSAARGYR